MIESATHCRYDTFGAHDQSGVFEAVPGHTPQQLDPATFGGAGGLGLTTPHLNPEMTKPKVVFTARPGVGTLGRPVRMRATFFPVQLTLDQDIIQYDMQILDGDGNLREGRYKLPAPVHSDIIGAFVQQEKASPAGIFAGTLPAHDGRKTLFSARPLAIANDEALTQVSFEGRTFEIRIRKVGQLNLRDVFVDRTAASPSTLEAILALDIIFRQTPAMTHVSDGRNFYSPLNKSLLGAGYEIWHGHHQSLRSCQAGLLLNFDMTATAFVEEGHALTFACNILRMRPDELTDPRGLPDHLRQILMREIKLLKVAIQHRGQEKRKFRVIGLSRLGADQLTFPDSATGEQTTVAAYFDRTYAKLRFPHLPCLHVGSSKKHVYLPMEVCKVVAQRRTKKLGERMMGEMNAKTCTRPGERARHIHERAMAANYTGDVFLREFKIACMPELVAVQGRVLPTPLIQYGMEARNTQVKRS